MVFPSYTWVFSGKIRFLNKPLNIQICMLVSCDRTIRSDSAVLLDSVFRAQYNEKELLLFDVQDKLAQ